MDQASIDRLVRRAALLAGLAGLLAGCANAGPEAATAGAVSLLEQTVTIPSREEHGLSGVLFTPASTPLLPDRRPAIVLMHGCSGMADARGALAQRHRDWAERFARWGFVTLVLDSFGPRAIGSICAMKDRPIQPWKERTVDAYAALAWLAARRDVDATAVFLLGWSNGGSTVLSAVRARAPGRPSSGPGFKAAVAFYPGCGAALRQADYRPTLPLLILHGGADDWTPAAPCVALAQKLKSGGLPVRTVVYPGALHGFDQRDGPIRYLPGVYNPGAPGDRGAHVGTQPKARLEAIDEVEGFVRQMLGR